MSVAFSCGKRGGGIMGGRGIGVERGYILGVRGRFWECRT